VLVLEVGTDIGFRMLFKELGLMEEAHPLLVFHGNCSVTTAIYDPDCIPVCLSTVRHESLELGLRNIVPCHDIIEVLPKYHLSSSILLLHIADRNGHDSIICGVIDMASHGGPMLDALYVIEHDPSFSRSPPGCIHLTKCTPDPGPTSDILKTNTLSESESCPGNLFS
jgi:hypothetical protein